MATTTFDKPVGSNQILTSDVVDNLTTNDASKVLSAKQGKVLNDKIVYHDIGTFASVSALQTALATYGNAMQNNSDSKIQFFMQNAESVFYQTSYYGTITRGTFEGRYLINASGASEKDNQISGLLRNGTWSWYSAADQMATLVKHDSITETTDSNGVILTNRTINNVDIISEWAQYYVIKKYINSAYKWGFKVESLAGDTVTSTSVTINYAYITKQIIPQSGNKEEGDNIIKYL